ncbi:MAG: nuclear transport factor 2 family protein [Chthoniobacterales bacterium]|nr:MAG: nuclear transport factor 2 family protein [Chthoniobacterales bacterium]
MTTARYLFVVALLPLGVVAQDSPAPAPRLVATAMSTGTLPPAPPAPDANELARLLKEFLAGASRNDLSAHERFWADDLIYTGSVGRRLGKADILREVRAEGPPKADEGTTTYTAEEIRIQQYGDAAIVAFRLVGTTTKGDKTEVANYLNSGTFLKRNGKWQVVNWQATTMPAKAEEKK